MSAELSDEVVLRDLIKLVDAKVEETLKNKDLVNTIREVILELKAVNKNPPRSTFSFL